MPVSFAQKRNKTFLDEKETPLEFLNSDIHPACNFPERKRKYIYIERGRERGESPSRVHNRHFPRSLDITHNYLKITNTSPHNKYTLSAGRR